MNYKIATPTYAALLTLLLAVSVSSGCKGASTAEAETDDVRSANADKKAAIDAIATADKLYPQREDLDSIRQGIAALRQARTADPGNYDAAWRLAKFEYFLGNHTKDAKEQDKAFHDGIDAGRIAVKLQDGKPDGHFWLAANYGGIAENSTFAGLTSLDDIRTELQTVIRLDAGYEGGSAYLGLGQIDREAPSALGGNEKRAIEELEKGLRFGDKNSLLKVQLAEAYIGAKRHDEARKLLTDVVNMTPDPDYLPEHKDAVAEARKLLDNGLKLD
jgi:hypothetical protein